MADPEDAPLPRLGLLSELTDRRVLERLLDDGPATRAELAGRTGISKPTVSESVRRLGTAGLLEAAGRQRGGRGLNGTYYRLRPGVAVGLALVVGPDGVRAECVEPTGEVRSRAARPVPVPATADEVTPLVRAAAEEVLADGPPPRTAAVSLAGPVDAASGRLVALPDSPFLRGELDLPGLLADLVAPGEPVLVDNDVNWTALAEHRDGAACNLDELVYAYLGPGVGAAVLSRGEVRRGRHGLAGELAHVRTSGPDGTSRRLVECLADLGLLRAGAVDVDRVHAVLDAPPTDGSDQRQGVDGLAREGLVRAVAGALGSVAALLDPEAVVVGGPWATPGLLAALAAELAHQPGVPLRLRAAALGPDAPARGVRAVTVERLRRRLVG